MLSKPNVNDIIPKVGNRYEVALAVAKRARDISDKRLREGDKSIKDPVDIACKEIYDDKVYVKKDGQYVIDVSYDKNIEEYNLNTKKEEIVEANIEDDTTYAEVDETVEEDMPVEEVKTEKKSRRKKTDE
ncbi:MAG: DNA-directed RNA polymerase subunit omega [Clostridia bacterium]|nr:DNA-directed RNA polymerase subunit omega [Clostridia bacterium]